MNNETFCHLLGLLLCGSYLILSAVSFPIYKMKTLPISQVHQEDERYCLELCLAHDGCIMNERMKTEEKEREKKGKERKRKRKEKKKVFLFQV